MSGVQAAWIGFGDGLRFIVKIREQITGGFDFGGHFRRAVFGKIRHVVGIDADHGHPARQVIARKLNEAGADVLHVGTMVAHENDEQRGLALEIRERDGFSVGVRQPKIGRGRAERQHG